MLTSFSTALSALSANATAIDVTGNNLANLNTPGFKTVDATFSDMMSQTVGAQTEVGLGVALPKTSRSFSQGAVETGTGALTAALQGQGFFVVQNGSRALYTRVGNFGLDQTGMLVNKGMGLPAMGWNALNGVVDTNGAAGAIQISTRQLPPKVTTTMTVDMNLNAGAAVAETASVPVTVTDSLGKTHVLTVTFTKTAGGWDYAASLPASSGTATAAGSMTFNSSGVLTAPTAPVPIAITGLVDGAADMTIEWSLFESPGKPRVTQYTAPSSPSAISQNGYPSADMTKLEIGDGGRVIASFSNGQQQVVAVLGIAAVTNPDSMQAIGGNAYQPTVDSSVAPAAPAGTGGRGTVIGQALEASTVDIAKEFTNLIVYQRGYQAASRVIITADEISQETINLKR